ncbi:MAG: hypothetical protein ABJA98_13035 [Acidobacteriota bacterium]
MHSRARANPFPGLRPFMQEEADLFFGRDRQSDELVRRLAGGRFLAVVGTSGSGKSSLVRAGLLPSLEGGLMAGAGTHWRIATLRPQDDPIGFLARAIVETGVLAHLDLAQAAAEEVVETTLRRSSLGLLEITRLARLAPHENLLILVDQFEELFRFANLAKQRDAGDEAPAFVKLLLEAARQTELPIYVVITMRSDFIGDCDRFRGLPEAISNSQYLIPRLTRDELQAVITGPIGVRGGRIAPRLVQRLLNDIGDDFDQLPVLQHALMRAWDHWQHEDQDGRPIDLVDMEAIGGMAAALSRHADEAFGALTSDRDRTVAERLFKCLTERGPDNREIRCPTSLSRIAAIANVNPTEVTPVIDVFRAPGRSFLMPPDGVALDTDSVIDISHESLIRQWGRLRTWVEEEAESRATYLRLVEAARLHLAGKAGLWGEPDLTYARQWQERDAPNTAWARRYASGFEQATEFLVASRERDAQRIEEELRHRQAMVLAALERQTAAETLAAEQLRATARAEADAARLKKRGRQLIAFAFSVAGVALLAGWFAVKAGRESRRAEQQFRQATALRLNADAQATLTGARAGGSVLGLLKLLAAHSIAPHVEIEGAMGAQVHAFQQIEKVIESTSAVQAVGFSPDGTRLVSGNFDNTLRQWDADSGQPIGAPMKGHQDYVTSAAYSADGARIVSGSEDGTLRLWNATSGQAVGEAMHGHEDSVNCVAFGAEGRRIVSGSDDKTLRLWDAHDGLAIGSPMRGHEDFIFGVAFNRAGTRIVSGSRDRTLRLWDANSGQAIGAPMRGHAGSVTSVAFSPDGARILSGGEDSTLRLWDTASGRPIGVPMRGHERWVGCIAFSPDGARIVSGSQDKTLRLWDAKSAQPIGAPMQGHEAAVNSVGFSPDGRRIVSAGDDKTLRLWNPTGGQSIAVLKGHTDQVSSVAFSPDGARIVSGSFDNSLRLWDARSGLPIGAPIPGNQVAVTAVAFTPDGTRIASGNFDGGLRLWDARNGQPIGAPMLGHGNAVTSIGFSPDGTQVVSASKDTTLRLWDAKTGRPIGEPMRGHGDVVNSVAFSPDGSRIVSASDDQTLRLWEAKTGRAVGAPMRSQDDKVRSAAFSPDGTRIVAGGENNALRVWDARSGQPVGAPMRGHGGSITSVAFSPDGTRIVSGSSDKMLRLWDAASGQPIGVPMEGHETGVTSVAFSPDGTRIASGSNDKTIRLWSAPIVWPNLLCSKLTRNMSRKEWREHVSSDIPFACQCPGLPIPSDDPDSTAAAESCSTGR